MATATKQHSAVESGTTDVTDGPVNSEKGRKRGSSGLMGEDTSIIQQESCVAIIQDLAGEEATSDDQENSFVPNQQRKRRTSGGCFEVSKVFVMENGTCSHTLPGEVSAFRADNADPRLVRSVKTAINALDDRKPWKGRCHGGRPTTGTVGEHHQHNKRDRENGSRIVLNDLNKDSGRSSSSVIEVFRATPTPQRKKRRVLSVSSRQRRRGSGAGKAVAKSRRRLAYGTRKRPARSELALKRRRVLRVSRLNKPSRLVPVASASPVPLPGVPVIRTPSKQHSRRRITFSPENDGESFACPYKIRFSSPLPCRTKTLAKTRKVQPLTPFGKTMHQKLDDHAASTVRCSTMQEIRHETFATDGLYEEGTMLIGVKSLKEAFLENGGNLKILRETLLKGFTGVNERMQIEAMLGEGEPVKNESSRGRGKNLHDVVDTLSTELSRLSIVPECNAMNKGEALSGYATNFICESQQQAHFFGGGNFLTSFRGV